MPANSDRASETPESDGAATFALATSGLLPPLWRTPTATNDPAIAAADASVTRYSFFLSMRLSLPRRPPDVIGA
jgi:hypothetical protein